ncbi:MAG: DUF354 domain-containing protein [Thermofilum sp.]
MKVWVEALTPKQVLLFSYLQGELPGEAFLTTRDYDLNVELAQALWRRFYVVGAYGGASLEGKLRQSLYRSRRLLEIVKSEEPDAHVTFASPDSVRVAFGLRIPIVAATDSPHSDAVSRLTLPLSRAVVVPKFLESSFSAYAKLTEIVKFEGLFELARILRGEPREKHVVELGLEPYRYALVRFGEQKSYYYPSAERALSDPLNITRWILQKTDLKVLAYPRYPDQKEAVRRTLERWSQRVIVLERPVDFLSLEFYAALVVTGGGTLATEASLVGTPALSTYPGRLEVFEYLKSLRFPLYQLPQPAWRLGSLLSRGAEPRDWRAVRRRLQQLFEDPVKVIVSAVLSAAGSKSF